MLEFVATALLYLHVSPPLMFAGFCGSIVFAAYGGTRPRNMVLAMLANTVTANYCGVAMATYLGDTSGIFAAFVLGVTGPVLVRKYLDAKIPGVFEEPKNG